MGFVYRQPTKWLTNKLTKIAGEKARYFYLNGLLNNLFNLADKFVGFYAVSQGAKPALKRPVSMEKKIKFQWGEE
ncbi:MAG: hypothetical protein GX581_06165 [Syntrophomonadaceae bacterium]|nr:hypothetical protein [Syntrophomonadaceae bacterium]